ncbi:hypothetical protein C942_02728 [Photobacterium marinum]|uniref:Uncharacterized protein n=2 Tax=Photobacterium marinum TaxID=1056511 RepID=L8JEG2_9GAMM|nr:hypothetical protein C942_02728 [Photobacterium marinum]
MTRQHVMTTAKEWLSQFADHYHFGTNIQVDDGHHWQWQLSINDVKPRWLINGYMNGTSFHIGCEPQCVLSCIEQAITEGIFSALPHGFQMMLVQQAAENWLRAIKTSSNQASNHNQLENDDLTNDLVVESLKADITTSENLTICLNGSRTKTRTGTNSQANSDVHTIKLYFSTDSAAAHPLLAPLLKSWPPRPVHNHPKMPVKSSLIAGFQSLSRAECEQLHTGALLCQGHYYFPRALLAIEGNANGFLLPINAEHDAHYVEKPSHLVQVLKLPFVSAPALSPSNVSNEPSSTSAPEQASDEQPDNYWLVMKSETLFLSPECASRLKRAEIDANSDEIATIITMNQAERPMVELFLIYPGALVQEQYCGQAEIVEYQGQTALAITRWFFPSTIQPEEPTNAQYS